MKTTSTLILFALITTILAGCGSSGSLNDTFAGRKVDYKKQSRTIQRLEIPPEMVSEKMNDFMVVSTLASEVEKTTIKMADGQVISTNGEESLLFKPKSISIINEGNIRSLRIQQEKAAVWKKIRQFFIKKGLAIKRETPLLGIIETDWLENRGDIPKDIISSTMGKVLGGLYSAGTRDKYRVRIEEASNLEQSETRKEVQLFLTHYGMFEAESKDTSGAIVWQRGPRDPELEAEMLGQIMVYLGLEAEHAKSMLAKSEKEKEQKAEIMNDKDGHQSLLIHEPFPRAWRRTGVALDRIDFVVEDRNRSQGIYFVQYADRDADDEKGLLSSLKFWGSNKPKKQEVFHIKLSSQGDNTHVNVLDKNNVVASENISKQIISLLFEQLK